mgnify:CR=1 FL=1
MAKQYEIAFQIRRIMYAQASMAEMEEKMGFSSEELEDFLNLREKEGPRPLVEFEGWRCCHRKTTRSRMA